MNFYVLLTSLITNYFSMQGNFLIYLLFYSVKEKNNIYLSYYLAVFIIFITDTDGELAEENMGSRVGIRYMFDKKNEFETELVGR